MQVWRVLNSGGAEGYLNMAIDEAILWSCQKGYVSPTLRFYEWTSPTLSVGYFQKVFKEFDVAACNKLKYPIVRRVTGGRAVLHDQEVTYSVVVPKGNSFFSTSILEVYQTLGAGLIKGCNMLGIEAQIISRPVKQSAQNNSMDLDRSPVCFSAPSWYEIVVGGKKLIGSAQKRLDGALLQQGSILMKFNLESLASVLRFKSEKVIKELVDRTISIKDLLKEEISYQQVVAGMIKGFEQGCGIIFQEAGLTPLEWKMAYHLYQVKYSQEAWNFRI
jgi:lipoate-protein ligase A